MDRKAVELGQVGAESPLAQIPEDQSFEAQKPEVENAGPDSSILETEAIWQIGQSSEHSHLLLHPVIGTFVKLKWKVAQSIFRRRVRFLWLFLIILTSEIFNEYKATARDGESLDKYEKRPVFLQKFYNLIENMIYNDLTDLFKLLFRPVSRVKSYL